MEVRTLVTMLRARSLPAATTLTPPPPSSPPPDPTRTPAYALPRQCTRYLYLDVAMQKQLARAIGTTPETIIQNLLDIDLGTALF